MCMINSTDSNAIVGETSRIYTYVDGTEDNQGFWRLLKAIGQVRETLPKQGSQFGEMRTIAEPNSEKSSMRH